MSKNNTKSNHSFICHHTKGVKKEISIGKTSYIVETLFRTSGPTISECIELQIKNRLENNKL